MSDREQVFPQESGGVPPLAYIAPIVIASVLLFLLSRRNNPSTANRAAGAVRETAQDVSRKGGSASRRALLTLIINALENDALRRVVLIGLKFARDRM